MNRDQHKQGAAESGERDCGAERGADRARAVQGLEAYADPAGLAGGERADVPDRLRVAGGHQLRGDPEHAVRLLK